MDNLEDLENECPNLYAYLMDKLKNDLARINPYLIKYGRFEIDFKLCVWCLN